MKGLCEKFKGVVYLTSRDINRGKQAVEKLKEQGLNPKFHQLDITDQTSVDKFRDYIKTTYGGLDILINNAAIAFKVNISDLINIIMLKHLFFRMMPQIHLLSKLKKQLGSIILAP